MTRIISIIDLKVILNEKVFILSVVNSINKGIKYI